MRRITGSIDRINVAWAVICQISDNCGDLGWAGAVHGRYGLVVQQGQIIQTSFNKEVESCVN